MITNSCKPYSRLGRDLDGISGIYALTDPRSNRVMYVGQSLDIGTRYRIHVDPDTYHDNLPKSTWMKGLNREGLVPGIRVIRECRDLLEMDEIERSLIRSFKAEGLCELNISVGGNSRAISKMLSTSKDDWIQLGRSLGLAIELLNEIECMVFMMTGTRSSSRVKSIIVRLCQLRSHLESQMHRAIPAWPHGSRAFYGRDDGKPGDGKLEDDRLGGDCRQDSRED